MLDEVCMVWAGLLKESLEVVNRWPRLMLAAMCSSRDVPHVRAIYFLVVTATVVGRTRNPLRTLLAPLLATLLGIMDGDVGCRLLAIARGRLPAA
jgi:hypothetical protein